jgi:hypothetical protein
VIEKTQFSMPASNVGSGAATAVFVEYFGPGKWDKPPQIAALLDGLILQTEGIREVWQEEKPMFPAITDPAGSWKLEDDELARALVIYKAMRDEVGRVTGIDNPEAVSHIRDALLFGRWDFYDETGIAKPEGVKATDTLPLVQIPYRVAAAMGAIVKHDHDIFIKWVSEDLPASVAEAPATVAKFVGETAGKVAKAAGETTGKTVAGLWSALPLPGKLFVIGGGALFLRKLWREGSR